MSKTEHSAEAATSQDLAAHSGIVECGVDKVVAKGVMVSPRDLPILTWHTGSALKHYLREAA
jgi:hypothetical protein